MQESFRQSNSPRTLAYNTAYRQAKAAARKSGMSLKKANEAGKQSATQATAAYDCQVGGVQTQRPACPQLSWVLDAP